jgi:hypothetical protein
LEVVLVVVSVHRAFLLVVVVLVAIGLMLRAN